MFAEHYSGCKLQHFWYKLQYLAADKRATAAAATIKNFLNHEQVNTMRFMFFLWK
jgi:hypothetical protein